MTHQTNCCALCKDFNGLKPYCGERGCPCHSPLKEEKHDLYYCCRGGAHAPLRCYCACTCPQDFCKKCGYVIVDRQCRCNPHGHSPLNEARERMRDKVNEALHYVEHNGKLYAEEMVMSALDTYTAELLESVAKETERTANDLGPTNNDDYNEGYRDAQIASADIIRSHIPKV